MKSVFLLSFVLATTLLAEDSVSNAELSRKLDLILGKVSGLEERVAELEKANSEVKKEMQAVQKTATEAKTASQSLVLPEDEEEKSFMAKLRLQLLEKRGSQSGRAWTKEETWTAGNAPKPDRFQEYANSSATRPKSKTRSTRGSIRFTTTRET